MCSHRRFSHRSPRSAAFAHEGNSTSSWLLTFLTLLLIGVSAWAFGGSFPWGPGLLLGLTLLIFPVLIAKLQERARIHKRAFIPAALWVVFVGIALLNPSHVIGELGWQPRQGWISWLPTTPSLGRTENAAIPWLMALLLGGMLAACPLGQRQTRLIWSAVALNGFVLAVVGAAFRFMGSSRLLGLVEAPESYFFATFFYKNHWAAYGALCGGAGLALALDACPEALRGSPQARGRMFLFGATSVLTLVTLPIPGSRSGLLLGAVLLLFAVGIFAWLSVRRAAETRRPRWISMAATIVLVTGIVSYGALIYAKTGAEDLERTELQLTTAKRLEDVELRMVFSRDTWHMAQQRPWFGWGPGSFEIVFPIFQGDYLRDADGRPTVRFDAAHNDWLQQLAETGVTGLLLFVIPIVLIAISGWRRGGIASRWGLGVGGLLLVYALIDFPFRNMAVLILWTVLWVTAGQLGSSKNRTLKKPRPSPDTQDFLAPS